VRQVCRSSLMVCRLSWKRVRCACSVKVRPCRVWTKYVVCYRVGGYVHDRLSTYFFHPPVSPAIPFLSFYSLSLFRHTNRYLYVHVRMTHGKDGNHQFYNRNKHLLNFRIAARQAAEKKRNHCVLIFSTIHFAPEFCDNSLLIDIPLLLHVRNFCNNLWLSFF